MGYRSCVGICLTQEATTALFTSIIQLPAEVQHEVQSLFHEADCERHDGSCHAWSWGSIKWYTSEPEIAFVEEFLNTLAGDDYVYLRIGEEFDDIEVTGYYFDNPLGMSIQRRIEFY